MTAQTILAELQPLGLASYKKVMLKHGVPEPFFGVKIEELKKIQKRVKQDYQLALDLYDTGNYDAMYLAGLIADDAKMTKRDLQHWLDLACEPLAGHTVPSVAAGSPVGWAMGLKWIDSKKPIEVAAGWGTLSSIISVTDDAKLDLAKIKELVERVQKTIHESPDKARYRMNTFVICVGCYVKSLLAVAKQAAEKIGKVTIDLGDTACKVPFAPDYIRKVEGMGRIGKKRKSAKC